MFGNITKKGVLIVKGLKKDGVSLLIRGKGRGLKAKLPFPFLPSTQNRGGVTGAAAAPGRRPWAAVAHERREKRGQAALGVDPPFQF